MDELENSIIKRIIEVRTGKCGTRGRNKFAGLLDLSPSTYSYYEKDRIPPVAVLIKISEVANVDLNWLLTGQTGQVSREITGPSQKIISQTQRVIEKQPQSADAISAFLNLLDEKAGFEAKVRLRANQQKDKGWIPVLGRTAAGVLADWSSAIGTDSKLIETQIEHLVKKHLNATIVNSLSADVAIDSQAKAVIQALNSSQASLVQTVGSDDEIVQFVDCPQLQNLFPDSFALCVDGDSMSPRINDGDVVVVSPSVVAVEGLPAIIRVSGAIGVTCKLIRNNERAVHLIPINERYDTKIADKKDVLWTLAVICHIKVKK